MEAMSVRTSLKAKLSAVFSVFCLLPHLCHSASNTITVNGSLSGDQTIISTNGLYELGFFKPGKTSVSNYYIGIWYKKIPLQTVFWVANREKPVSDKYSSELKISENGNLALFTNVSDSPIWSTNLKLNPSQPTEAVLQDDGNLVLGDGSNSTSPLWQSFDYPADTLMPGAKLGLNKTTKWARVLTAWKNSEDPSPGVYAIERDPNASQFIMLYNRTEQYWSSGLWIPDQRIFSLIPELRFLKTQLYSFSYIDNDNESYITFNVSNPSIVTRLVMDTSGQIKHLTWLDNTQQWVLFWSQPGQQCQVHAFCGAFGSCNQNSLPYCHCLEGFEPKAMAKWNLNDYSSGCVRKTKLDCEGHTDKFLVSPGMVLPEHAKLISSVSSVDECESTCLGNCSCTAYAYDGDNGCSVWFGELLNMRQLSSTDTSGKTLYIRLAASDIQGHSNKRTVIGVLVGLVMGLALLLGLVSLIYWRQKQRLITAAKTMKSSLTRFGYRDLQSSTKNFSQKLGGGGFGSVFKGTLPDSTVIAVKKLESVISEIQGEKQFRAEVAAIGTLQHVNLVRLRGFCSEGTKRLLVYEYMPNGSLNTHLFSKQNTEILSWQVRYQIAIGVAKGLAYLHEECRDCIIHCDIKPENILLDAEFCPKVADFGLAKLVGREFSRVLTTIRGTRGYLAPEWISGLAITSKADVYSYGMMLFELISGKRNTHQSSEGKVEFFPTWAMAKLLEGEDILSILDPRIEGEAEKTEVMRMCKLACWCVQDEENQRPSMGQAVKVLEGLLLDFEMPLMPRSLRVFADDEESVLFFSDDVSFSQGSVERTTYGTANSSSIHGR